MKVRFIVGRAGSGKSRLCMDEMIQELKKQPDGPPLILIVPEQATFQTELALVDHPDVGGTIRAQVLSFRRLAWRIMQERGGTARQPIDDVGKKLLLHKLLHKRKDDLRFYQSVYEQTGFVDRLNDLFAEWRRYCVTGDGLSRHVETYEEFLGSRKQLLRDKMRDLQVIYSAFEEEISVRYLDGEGTLAKLAEELGQSRYMQDARIWIDGFHGFTPQELRVVRELFRTSREISVSLCLNRPYYAGEIPEELDLFHPTARTMVQLQELLDEIDGGPAETIVIEPAIKPRFAASPMLAHLEQNFEQRMGRYAKPYLPADKSAEGEQVTLYAAVNRRAEAEGVAREMTKLAREQGVRWRDMAVMVRDMGSYEDLLETTFTDYGIPHFFDQKRTVLHHPLAEFIRSALEVVLHNWGYDAVFRCVKTDLLLPWAPSGAAQAGNGSSSPQGVDSAEQAAAEAMEAPAAADLTLTELRAAMDRLENYVLSYGIQGSRWTDGKPWTHRSRASLEEEETAANAAEEKFLQEIQQTRQWVAQPLLRFQKRLRKSKTVQARTEALYELLTDVHAPERLEAWHAEAVQAGKPEKAREHSQLWGSLMDLFDQLIELMGDEEISAELYAELLETGLESIKLGLVPPALDQVLVGSMDRTRSMKIRYAFILGVSDGVIPASQAEDGVLAESERELLLQTGLPMADGNRRRLLDESFLIYSSLAVPSRQLSLSYPLADEEGKSLLPSELVRQIKGLLPHLKEVQWMGEPSPAMSASEQLAYMASPARALSYLGVQLKQWMRGAAIGDIWWGTYNYFVSEPQWRGSMHRLVQGLLYSNREERLPRETSRLLYGRHLRASVSRMERYVACPFSHFLTHGLKLRERRVFRLEAPDIGQLFHGALNLFVKGIQEDKVDWASLSSTETYRRTSDVVDRLAPRLQGEILLSSKRYRYISHKLKQVVGKAAIMLGEHAKRSRFAPVGLEIDFGPGGTLPSLSFQLDNGCTMEIIGRIDRVDQAQGDSGLLLRVIDYKSSPTALDLSSVYYGLSLQMLTYLDVILTHAPEWLGMTATPAGVLYFHVHNPLLQFTNGMNVQDIEKELRKRYKMKGLLMADPDVVRMMDSGLQDASGHSQLVPAALSKDGGFYKSSSVASEEQWDTLRGFVRSRIRDIGTEITDGRVDITPYRTGNKSACQHCSYKAVCQFDPVLEGNEPNHMIKMGRERVWAELSKTQPDRQESGKGERDA
ncbi:PD-(D/E)XK nuclease family protein [Paenibacillus lutrae]|uniref:ATP-dependent helicase/deoxyribonuclease subunit B n=1 Tax=Paenibacillus lutrae TaxID=2078573 RepID=A0A7X3JYZ0_9BACL|nr:PD-(D/E)XK nuclease family protein [Paenibacillus lutrae]MVO99454.1 helicase-exonuclease AddAB subunit AddB [Paenibacillus lutrae]